MYFLLIAVTGLAYARQQCTLAAEFGFKPVQASPTTWISHIRPVGWDTQGPCPRTDATVPFTTFEGASPDVAETALPVFLYRRTQEITQGQTSTIETWTLIGSTPRNAQPSACSTLSLIHI